MKQLTPYLAIDIETTGLDTNKAQILQLAAVWETFDKPIEELKSFSVIVDNGVITHGEPIALGMNAHLLEKIKESHMTVYRSAPGIELQPDAALLFRQFVEEVGGGKRIFVGGKNLAGFDIPILQNNGFSANYFKHRVVDPGAMFMSDFGYPPSLDEINRFLGRPKVSHDALQDCKDVIYAVRHKLGFLDMNPYKENK